MYVYIHITESLCYTEEVNTTLQSNYMSIKNIKNPEKQESQWYKSFYLSPSPKAGQLSAATLFA